MALKRVLTAYESAASKPDQMGGKATNLVHLLAAGLQVPRYIVLTADALEAQLRTWKLDAWLVQQAASIKDMPNSVGGICTAIQQMLSEHSLSSDLLEEISIAIKAEGLDPDEHIAVRSSVVGEDAVRDSFAGQMDSFLFLKGMEQIADAIKKCWVSAWGERAIRYRLQKGLPIASIRVGVIIQQMIPGEVSGVLFTANPTNGNRKEALLTATYGLGEGLVSGRCNADEYTVSTASSQILHRAIANKDIAIVLDSGNGFGTSERPVTEIKALKPCLTDELIKKLVSDGYQLARALHAPQDIEWTVYNNVIWYLQTRPVTSLPSARAGRRIVWNNSNIQESYLGVTTPLTFSFARMAYARVYTDTMRIMGISEKVVEGHKDMLQNLLGLLNGRVYYNINNWYKGLLLLPSFKTNKGDMEAMMGLQEQVDFIQDSELSTVDKLRKLPGMLQTFSRLLFKFRQMDGLVADFQRHFNAEYSRVDRQSLHTMQLPELMDLVRHLEQHMLGHWQTPIINDFYVMMNNGRVKRGLKKTGLDNAAALQNNLLSGEPGIESIEPTLELMRLATIVRGSATLKDIFSQTGNEYLLPILHLKEPAFHKDCLNYLELYGDRCMGELKLESISLRQRPAFMFAIIRNYIDQPGLSAESIRAREQSLRQQAELEAFTAIRKRDGALALHRFKNILHAFRRGVRNRENMRLARTRMFGLFRDIYLEIGQQLAVLNILGEARDIFYLTVDEIKDFEGGTSVNTDLKDIVALRKDAFAAYEAKDLPNHLETFGSVYPLAYSREEGISFSGNSLKGLGCYPGIVKSSIRLIFSPEDELNINKRILCTIRTDPGWAPLFPTCSGIIVERGSTLSHSAVVARELGIPAIVGVPNVTSILKDGDTVQMNGGTGVIDLIVKQDVG